MRIRKTGCILAILLMALILTACPAVEDREETLFDTLTYETPDRESFFYLAEEIDSLTGDAENAAEILASFDMLLEEYLKIETMYVLASIHNSLDVTDQYYIDEISKSYDVMLESHREALRTAKAILASPCREEAERHWGAEAVEEYENAVLNTEEQNAMLAREQEIILKYQVAAQEEAPVDFIGDGNYYQEVNRVLGPYFIELAALRTELAQSYGYENYIEYIYDLGFERSYSPQDVKNLFADAGHMAGVFEAVYFAEDFSRADRYLDYGETLDLTQITAMISPYFKNVDPKMEEAYAFMLENKLYDFKDSPGKDSGAYVIFLPAPDFPFMFINPQHDRSDISTFIHEFGHFNNDYQNGREYRKLLPSSNLDLMEIHSQGLEVLFSEMAEEVFGDSDFAYAFRYYTLENLLYVTVDAALMGSFEIMVYENPHYTLDEINEAMGQLTETLDVWYFDENYKYAWADYSHLYQAGGYYISYGTSALSTLELWLAAREDWDQGVALYLNTVEQGANKDYQDALAKSGLGDPFTPEYMKEMSESLMDAFLEMGWL